MIPRVAVQSHLPVPSHPPSTWSPHNTGHHGCWFPVSQNLGKYQFFLPSTHTHCLYKRWHDLLTSLHFAFSSLCLNTCPCHTHRNSFFPMSSPLDEERPPLTEPIFDSQMFDLLQILHCCKNAIVLMRSTHIPVGRGDTSAWHCSVKGTCIYSVDREGQISSQNSVPTCIPLKTCFSTAPPTTKYVTNLYGLWSS